MAIEDNDFLAYIRSRPCAFCGKTPPSQAHHVNCNGMGGGARLDKALAVLPVCWECHGRYQADRKACFAKIEEREGLEPGQAQAAVWKLLRTKKEMRV